MVRSARADTDPDAQSLSVCPSVPAVPIQRQTHAKHRASRRSRPNCGRKVRVMGKTGVVYPFRERKPSAPKFPGHSDALVVRRQRHSVLSGSRARLIGIPTAERVRPPLVCRGSRLPRRKDMPAAISKPVLLTALPRAYPADNQGMQMVLLGMASFLMALWGVGAVVHASAHLTWAWVAWAPRAAAALVFMGMCLGPTRSGAGRDGEHSEQQ